MGSGKTVTGAVASAALMMAAVASNSYDAPIQISEVVRPAEHVESDQPPIAVTGGYTAETVEQAALIVKQVAAQTGYAVAEDVDYGVVMLQQQARGWDVVFLLQGSDPNQMSAFMQTWLMQLFPTLRALPPPNQGQDGSIRFEIRQQHLNSQRAY